MTEHARSGPLRSFDRLPLGRVAAGRSRVADLRRRMAVLEDEVQELRRLHHRLAQLTDVVEELLVPIAQRDEAKLQECLDRYSESL